MGNQIRGNVYIGEGTILERGVNITGSDNHPVKIGKNVLIKGVSYLYGSIVDNNAYIEHCIFYYSHVKALKDKNGNRIWENNILMCHGNPDDLVKVVFGEFGVRNAETGTIVDKVIGWHYEVVPTDTISRCEPFCWPMPLAKDYIERCEMEVVENSELLQEKRERK